MPTDRDWKPISNGPGFYEDDEPVEKITAAFEAGEKGVTAPPPDLDQAIRAARETLTDNYDWDGYDVFEIARVAVEAAAPYLLRGASAHTLGIAAQFEQERNQARDRLAALEVHAAELHDLLAKCSFCWMEPDHTHCGWCGLRQDDAANPIHDADCKLAHALQVPPPERGRQTLHEVQQLRARLDDYENAISWQVNCTNCAKLLDASIADHDHAEQLQTEVQRLRTENQELRGAIQFALRDAENGWPALGFGHLKEALDQAAPQENPQ